MVVDIGVTIPMRDGVETVADVYRPAAEGRWPVVMTRCPYDRSDPHMGSMVIVDPAWLARHGFAVIVQDTRGRGESDGEFDPFFQEIDDGYDTVEWAAVQPWSTGAVGIYGASYMGIAAYQAVASRAPHLRAAVAFVGTPQMSMRTLGGPLSAVSSAWYGLLLVLETVRRRPMDPDAKASLMGRIIGMMMDANATGSILPLTDVDVLSDPELAPFWREWLREPNVARQSATPTLGTDPTRVGDVALLQVTGYRDFIADGAFRLASALAHHPKHRLIAGPWTHRGPYQGSTGARELPGTSSPAGPLGWGPLLAAWFDIHLRGGTGAAHPGGLMWLGDGPIRYYVEGENRWASAASWPPPTVMREWALSSEGDARSAHGNGRLLPPGSAPSAERADRFDADPRNPFPTCGGGMQIPEQGPEGIQDQRAVDHRDDVLVYTSDVLTSAVEIAGRPRVAVSFSSTAPDADICITLVDVEPDGFAYNVADGAQRTRYRRGGNADWLEPGTVTEVEVPLHDTAHVFRPGHRIRVMIAGASYPRLSRNLHTKTVPELGTVEEAVIATHAVHHGGAQRSRLLLPQVER
jgi:putative CocE/NonD family hydrolase